MSKASEKKEKADSSLKTLKEWIKPGDTVYTTVTHVSRSGMSRSIRAFITLDGRPTDISWHVANACGFTLDDKNGGCKLGGCGMDMGFALVYDLAATLFRDGFECIGYDENDRSKRCPSNDHNNGDKDYTPHHHNSGGYCIRQEWL